VRTKKYLEGAHVIEGYPSVCARCRTPKSAEGYYETRAAEGLPVVRIGICKAHKAYGGSKIFWFESEEKPTKGLPAGIAENQVVLREAVLARLEEARMERERLKDKEIERLTEVDQSLRLRLKSIIDLLDKRL
jgi:hypothetical protein